MNFHRLLLLIAGPFLLIHFGFSAAEWYSYASDPEKTLPEGKISPLVDMIVVLLVFVVYAMYRAAVYFMGRDERDFYKRYGK